MAPRRPTYRSSEWPPGRSAPDRRWEAPPRALGSGSPGEDGSSRRFGNLWLLAGVLVVGVGIGSFITTTQSAGSRTGNIASSQDLDLAVPDPEFCKQWGASAYVMDVELYQTMNPVSSFVTQPKLQPGCVIRRENWSVLQQEGVVSSEDMRRCKQRMNTFAYIGSIRDQPIVRCVYQTDRTDNLFLGRSGEEGGGALSDETGRF